MIRRHLLAALAAGIEAGDDEAARAEVRRADWLVRGSAARELDRALIDAALVSGSYASGADPDTLRHVQRVAALTIAARYDVDATDPAAVAEAYRELPRVRAPAPVATVALAAGLLVAMVLVAWAIVRLRTPVHHPRPLAPLVAGAFFTGGVPARDAAIEHLLAGPLADLVVACDADRHGGGTDRVRRADAATLRDAPAIVARGPALARAWGALIDSLEAFVDVPVHDRRFRAAEAELGLRAHEVSDQLAALGLGYYLQADVFVQRHVAHAAVFAYRVAEVTYVEAGGEPRRVLGLRRLDRVNLVRTLLGMQPDEGGDPVLLLDRIDEFVDDHVAPVVAPGAPYRLGDASWRQTSSGRALAAAAGEAVRRELVARLGPDAADRTRLARLVASSVRRHEARHGVDLDRERPLRTPVVLAAVLGSARDPASRRFAFRARAELAAYTSQIANDPATPQLALWNLASQAFHRDHWGSAESYAALIVLEGLAAQIGLHPAQPIVHGGQIDRPRLAALVRPLAGLSTTALRDAARGLWTTLYGEPNLPIVDPSAAP